MDPLHPISERAQAASPPRQQRGRFREAVSPFSPSAAERGLKIQSSAFPLGPPESQRLSFWIYREQFAQLMTCWGFSGALSPPSAAQSRGGAWGKGCQRRMRDRRSHSSIPSPDGCVTAPGC